MQRLRGADGSERAEDQLHGIRAGEESQFDSEWQQRRAQRLQPPAHGAGGARGLPDAHSAGFNGSGPANTRSGRGGGAWV